MALLGGMLGALAAATGVAASPVVPQQHQQHEEVAYIVEARTDAQPILAYTGFAAGPQNSDWQQVRLPAAATSPA
jgi:P pilus assembly chaperone PapD